MPTRLGNATVGNLLPGFRHTTDKDGDAIDAREFVGELLIHATFDSGVSDPSTITVQHSDDGSTGWEAVPEVPVINLTVGTPVSQTTYLHSDSVKRYIRAIYTRTGSSIAIGSVTFIANKKAR